MAAVSGRRTLRPAAAAFVHARSTLHVAAVLVTDRLLSRAVFELAPPGSEESGLRLRRSGASGAGLRGSRRGAHLRSGHLRGGVVEGGGFSGVHLGHDGEPFGDGVDVDGAFPGRAAGFAVFCVASRDGPQDGGVRKALQDEYIKRI